jgi:hypothetical protein
VQLGPARQLYIVVDCLAGQSLTMLMIALARPIEICNSMAIGFAFFRLLDFVISSLALRRFSHPLIRRLVIGALAGVLSLVVMHLVPGYFD